MKKNFFVEKKKKKKKDISIPFCTHTKILLNSNFFFNLYEPHLPTACFYKMLIKVSGQEGDTLLNSIRIIPVSPTDEMHFVHSEILRKIGQPQYPSELLKKRKSGLLPLNLNMTAEQNGLKNGSHLVIRRKQYLRDLEGSPIRDRPQSAESTKQELPSDTPRVDDLLFKDLVIQESIIRSSLSNQIQQSPSSRENKLKFVCHSLVLFQEFQTSTFNEIINSESDNFLRIQTEFKTSQTALLSTIQQPVVEPITQTLDSDMSPAQDLPYLNHVSSFSEGSALSFLSGTKNIIKIKEDETTALQKHSLQLDTAVLLGEQKTKWLEHVAEMSSGTAINLISKGRLGVPVIDSDEVLNDLIEQESAARISLIDDGFGEAPSSPKNHSDFVDGCVVITLAVQTKVYNELLVSEDEELLSISSQLKSRMSDLLVSEESRIRETLAEALVNESSAASDEEYLKFKDGLKAVIEQLAAESDSAVEEVLSKETSFLQHLAGSKKGSALSFVAGITPPVVEQVPPAIPLPVETETGFRHLEHVSQMKEGSSLSFVSTGKPTEVLAQQEVETESTELKNLKEVSEATNQKLPGIEFLIGETEVVRGEQKTKWLEHVAEMSSGTAINLISKGRLGVPVIDSDEVLNDLIEQESAARISLVDDGFGEAPSSPKNHSDFVDGCVVITLAVQTKVYNELLVSEDEELLNISSQLKSRMSDLLVSEESRIRETLAEALVNESSAASDEEYLKFKDGLKAVIEQLAAESDSAVEEVLSKETSFLQHLAGSKKGSALSFVAGITPPVVEQVPPAIPLPVETETGFRHLEHVSQMKEGSSLSFVSTGKPTEVLAQQEVETESTELKNLKEVSEATNQKLPGIEFLIGETEVVRGEQKTKWLEHVAEMSSGTAINLISKGRLGVPVIDSDEVLNDLIEQESAARISLVDDGFGEAPSSPKNHSDFVDGCVVITLAVQTKVYNELLVSEDEELLSISSQLKSRMSDLLVSEESRIRETLAEALVNESSAASDEEYLKFKDGLKAVIEQLAAESDSAVEEVLSKETSFLQHLAGSKKGSALSFVAGITPPVVEQVPPAIPLPVETETGFRHLEHVSQMKEGSSLSFVSTGKPTEVLAQQEVETESTELKNLKEVSEATNQKLPGIEFLIGETEVVRGEQKTKWLEHVAEMSSGAAINLISKGRLGVPVIDSDEVLNDLIEQESAARISLVDDGFGEAPSSPKNHSDFVDGCVVITLAVQTKVYNELLVSEDEELLNISSQLKSRMSDLLVSEESRIRETLAEALVNESSAASDEEYLKFKDGLKAVIEQLAAESDSAVEEVLSKETSFLQHLAGSKKGSALSFVAGITPPVVEQVPPAIPLPVETETGFRHLEHVSQMKEGSSLSFVSTGKPTEVLAQQEVETESTELKNLKEVSEATNQKLPGIEFLIGETEVVRGEQKTKWLEHVAEMSSGAAINLISKGRLGVPVIDSDEVLNDLIEQESAARISLVDDGFGEAPSSPKNHSDFVDGCVVITLAVQTKVYNELLVSEDEELLNISSQLKSRMSDLLVSEESRIRETLAEALVNESSAASDEEYLKFKDGLKAVIEQLAAESDSAVEEVLSKETSFLQHLAGSKKGSALSFVAGITPPVVEQVPPAIPLPVETETGFRHLEHVSQMKEGSSLSFVSTGKPTEVLAQQEVETESTELKNLKEVSEATNQKLPGIEFLIGETEVVRGEQKTKWLEHVAEMSSGTAINLISKGRLGVPVIDSDEVLNDLIEQESAARISLVDDGFGEAPSSPKNHSDFVDGCVVITLAVQTKVYNELLVSEDEELLNISSQLKSRMSDLLVSEESRIRETLAEALVNESSAASDEEYLKFKDGLKAVIEQLAAESDSAVEEVLSKETSFLQHLAGSKKGSALSFVAGITPPVVEQVPPAIPLPVETETGFRHLEHVSQMKEGSSLSFVSTGKPTEVLAQQEVETESTELKNLKEVSEATNQKLPGIEFLIGETEVVRGEQKTKWLEHVAEMSSGTAINLISKGRLGVPVIDSDEVLNDLIEQESAARISLVDDGFGEAPSSPKNHSDFVDGCVVITLAVQTKVYNELLVSEDEELLSISSQLKSRMSDLLVSEESRIRETLAEALVNESSAASDEEYLKFKDGLKAVIEQLAAESDSAVEEVLSKETSFLQHLAGSKKGSALSFVAGITPPVVEQVPPAIPLPVETETGFRHLEHVSQMKEGSSLSFVSTGKPTEVLAQQEVETESTELKNLKEVSEATNQKLPGIEFLIGETEVVRGEQKTKWLEHVAEMSSGTAINLISKGRLGVPVIDSDEVLNDLIEQESAARISLVDDGFGEAPSSPKNHSDFVDGCVVITLAVQTKVYNELLVSEDEELLNISSQLKSRMSDLLVSEESRIRETLAEALVNESSAASDEEYLKFKDGLKAVIEQLAAESDSAVEEVLSKETSFLQHLAGSKKGSALSFVAGITPPVVEQVPPAIPLPVETETGFRHLEHVSQMKEGSSLSFVSTGKPTEVLAQQEVETESTELKNLKEVSEATNQKLPGIEFLIGETEVVRGEQKTKWLEHVAEMSSGTAINLISKGRLGVPVIDSDEVLNDLIEQESAARISLVDDGFGEAPSSPKNHSDFVDGCVVITLAVQTKVYNELLVSEDEELLNISSQLKSRMSDLLVSEESRIRETLAEALVNESSAASDEEYLKFKDGLKAVIEQLAAESDSAVEEVLSKETSFLQHLAGSKKGSALSFVAGITPPVVEQVPPAIPLPVETETGFRHLEHVSQMKEGSSLSFVSTGKPTEVLAQQEVETESTELKNLKEVSEATNQKLPGIEFLIGETEVVRGEQKTKWLEHVAEMSSGTAINLISKGRLGVPVIDSDEVLNDLIEQESAARISLVDDGFGEAPSSPKNHSDFVDGCVVITLAVQTKVYNELLVSEDEELLNISSQLKSRMSDLLVSEESRIRETLAEALVNESSAASDEEYLKFKDGLKAVIEQLAAESDSAVEEVLSKETSFLQHLAGSKKGSALSFVAGITPPVVEQVPPAIPLPVETETGFRHLEHVSQMKEGSSLSFVSTGKPTEVLAQQEVETESTELKNLKEVSEATNQKLPGIEFLIGETEVVRGEQKTKWLEHVAEMSSGTAINLISKGRLGVPVIDSDEVLNDLIEQESAARISLVDDGFGEAPSSPKNHSDFVDGCVVITLAVQTKVYNELLVSEDEELLNISSQLKSRMSDLLVSEESRIRETLAEALVNESSAASDEEYLKFKDGLKAVIEQLAAESDSAVEEVLSKETSFLQHLARSKKGSALSFVAGITPPVVEQVPPAIPLPVETETGFRHLEHVSQMKEGSSLSFVSTGKPTEVLAQQEVETESTELKNLKEVSEATNQKLPGIEFLIGETEVVRGEQKTKWLEHVAEMSSGTAINLISKGRLGVPVIDSDEVLNDLIEQESAARISLVDDGFGEAPSSPKNHSDFVDGCVVITLAVQTKVYNELLVSEDEELLNISSQLKSRMSDLLVSEESRIRETLAEALVNESSAASDEEYLKFKDGLKAVIEQLAAESDSAVEEVLSKETSFLQHLAGSKKGSALSFVAGITPPVVEQVPPAIPLPVETETGFRHLEHVSQMKEGSSLSFVSTGKPTEVLAQQEVETESTELKNLKEVSEATNQKLPGIEFLIGETEVVRGEQKTKWLEHVAEMSSGTAINLISKGRLGVPVIDSDEVLNDLIEQESAARISLVDDGFGEAPSSPKNHSDFVDGCVVITLAVQTKVYNELLVSEDEELLNISSQLKSRMSDLLVSEESRIRETLAEALVNESSAASDEEYLKFKDGLKAVIEQLAAESDSAVEEVLSKETSFLQHLARSKKGSALSFVAGITPPVVEQVPPAIPLPVETETGFRHLEHVSQMKEGSSLSFVSTGKPTEVLAQQEVETESTELKNLKEVSEATNQKLPGIEFLIGETEVVRGEQKTKWLEHVAEMSSGTAINLISKGRLGVPVIDSDEVLNDLIEQESAARISLVDDGFGEAPSSPKNHSDFVDGCVVITLAVQTKVYNELLVSEDEELLNISSQLKSRMSDLLVSEESRIRETLAEALVNESSAASDEEYLKFKDGLKAVIEQLAAESDSAVEEVLSKETSFLQHLAGSKKGSALSFVAGITPPVVEQVPPAIPLPVETETGFRHLEHVSQMKEGSSLSFVSTGKPTEVLAQQEVETESTELKNLKEVSEATNQKLPGIEFLIGETEVVRGEQKTKWLEHVAEMSSGTAINLISKGRLGVPVIDSDEVLNDLIEQESAARISLVDDGFGEAPSSPKNHSDFVDGCVVITLAVQTKVYNELLVSEDEELLNISSQLKSRMSDLLVSEESRIRETLAEALVNESSAASDEEYLKFKDGLKAVIEQLAAESDSAVEEVLSKETSFLQHLAGSKKGSALSFVAGITPPVVEQVPPAIPLPVETETGFRHLEHVSQMKEGSSLSFVSTGKPTEVLAQQEVETESTELKNLKEVSEATNQKLPGIEFLIGETEVVRGEQKTKWLEHVAEMSSGAAINLISKGRLGVPVIDSDEVLNDFIEQESAARISLVDDGFGEAPSSPKNHSDFVDGCVVITLAVQTKVYNELLVSEDEELLNISSQLKSRMSDLLVSEESRIRETLAEALVNESSAASDEEYLKFKDGLKAVIEQLAAESDSAVEEVLSKETSFLQHLAGSKKGSALSFVAGITPPVVEQVPPAIPLPVETETGFRHLEHVSQMKEGSSLSFVKGVDANSYEEETSLKPSSDDEELKSNIENVKYIASLGESSSSIGFLVSNDGVHIVSDVTPDVVVVKDVNKNLTHIANLGTGDAIGFLSAKESCKTRVQIKPKCEETFEELRARSAYEQGILKSLWMGKENSLVREIESESCNCGFEKCEIRRQSLSDKVDYTRWIANTKGFTNLWTRKKIKTSIVEFISNKLTISQEQACCKEWIVKFHKKERLFHYSNTATGKKSYFPSKEVESLTKCSHPDLERVIISDKFRKSINRILNEQIEAYESYQLKKAAKKLVVLDPEKLVEKALQSGAWAEKTAIGGSKVYYIPRKGKGLEKKWKKDFAPFLIAHQQDKSRQKFGDFATPYCKKCDRHFALPPPRWECNTCKGEVWQPATGVKASHCKCCENDISKSKHFNKHCRKCGFLCCKDCTEQEMPLVSMGWSGLTQLTVCTKCGNK